MKMSVQRMVCYLMMRRKQRKMFIEDIEKDV